MVDQGVLSYNTDVQFPAPRRWPQAETPAVLLKPFVSSGHHDLAFYPATDDLGSLKTFIVEDNALIRRNLVETMNELLNVKILGFAETEQDALSWLNAHRRDWQLLIVDLFLPQGTGLGVLKQCLNRSVHQRVVVLSNYSTDEMRSRCMACGADAVFDKSTELDQFLAYCAIKH